MFRKILRKIRTFVRLPGRQKIWFVCCYFFSGIARAYILFLPFRWLAPRLGTHYQNIQLATVVSEEQEKLAWRIGRITEMACKYTPWESKCLVQAVLAKHILAYYKIPCVMYLGVIKSKDDNDLKAHAWLSTGRWVITGRDGHQPFTIVSTFVSPATIIAGYKS